MNKLILTSCAAAAVFALSACGENNDPIANIREATTDTALQGKDFSSGCSAKPLGAVLTGILTGGDASIKGQKTIYRFTGANVERTTEMYQAADCSGDAAAIFTESGDFSIDENQKTSDNGKFIDLQFSKLTVKTRTDAGVEVAKAMNLCGITDWSVNQESDVTAKAADLNCYGVKVAEVANVYRVDGDKLYLGTDDKGGTEKSDRPTTLALSLPYVEVK